MQQLEVQLKQEVSSSDWETEEEGLQDLGQQMLLTWVGHASANQTNIICILCRAGVQRLSCCMHE